MDRNQDDGLHGLGSEGGEKRRRPLAKALIETGKEHCEHKDLRRLEEMENGRIRGRGTGKSLLV